MATIDQLQEDAQTYASQLGTKIDTLIDTLTGLASISITPQDVSWAGSTFFDPVTSQLQSLIATTPTLATITEPTPTEPTFPTVASITLPTDIVVPDFNTSPPSVNIPSAPDFTPPTEPGGVPTIQQVSIPTAPSYDLPAVPTFQTLIAPTAPNVQIPTFTALAPDTSTVLAPTNTFAFAETPYLSDLLDTLGEKLLSDLEGGGYGIETVDELMLLDRATERETETASRAIDEASRTYAARRFDLPPGALLETIQRTTEAYQAASNTLSREIALKRYDQLVAARQFAITNGVQLENIKMTFHGAMMERFLNAARYTAEAAVAYFNAQLEKVKTDQAVYETQARVFEILVRSKVEELNVYRAQLEAERLKGELDRIKIEQYKAQIDGVRAAAEIFNLRMRSAEIQQGIERLKLEAYRSEIDAYVAKIHGSEIKLRAYEAQIRGEEAKGRVFETQARAYDSQVRGKEAAANIARLKVESQVQAAHGQIEVYNGQLTAYKTKYDAGMGIQKLRLDKFRSEYDGYAARANALQAMARVSIEAYNASKEDFLGVLRHNLEKAQYLFRVAESNRNWQGDVISKSVSFYAPLATAALSSINTLGVQTATS
jgi:hypothetical protein